jgi:probable F420-dependent oxidoreductase
MRIGAIYPQIELGGDPCALDRFGRAAEEGGFDHVLIHDHVVGAAPVDRDPPLWARGPYTHEHPFHDPLVAFGYLAAVTERIELVTGVLVLPQRQTVLVAKQATDVALLSGGRLRLGVGVGYNYVEFDALDQDFASRGARMDEQIPYLRRLWSEPLVTLDQPHHRIDRAAIVPRPPEPIPILCGGVTDRAYRRAATLADGFVFGGPIQDAVVAWTRVQELLRERGRDVAGFAAYFLTQDWHARGLSEAETVRAAELWRDAGGSHLSITTMWRDLPDVEAHLGFVDSTATHLDRAGLWAA